MNTDQIIAKQKELIEFYEMLFDGDTLQHIEEARIKLELRTLESSETDSEIDKAWQWYARQINKSIDEFDVYDQHVSRMIFEYAQSLPAKQDEQINNKK